MITINGTLRQHIYLNNWAWAHNEKILDFIPEINNKVDATDIYPIMTMPASTADWMAKNCHLKFVTASLGEESVD